MEELQVYIEDVRKHLFRLIHCPKNFLSFPEEDDLECLRCGEVGVNIAMTGSINMI